MIVNCKTKINGKMTRFAYNVDIIRPIQPCQYNVIIYVSQYACNRYNKCNILLTKKTLYVKVSNDEEYCMMTNWLRDMKHLDKLIILPNQTRLKWRPVRQKLM